MRRFFLATIVGILCATSAQAAVIEQACVKSKRQGATRSLCGCIQDAADLTLTGSEQVKVAAFFKDPHKAQELRQSDKKRDETFWGHYKQFGRTASKFCASP